MSEKKELYYKLDELNRIDFLTNDEEIEYGRLWSSARRFPLGDILKGSCYEYMSLEDKILGLGKSFVKKLSEKDICCASALLSMDRLSNDFSDAKWMKIMQAKDVILGLLPEKYLDRWLDEDPSLEPLHAPIEEHVLNIPVIIPADFDFESIKGIRLDNVRALIDDIGNKLYTPLLNFNIQYLDEIFKIKKEDQIPGGGSRFFNQLEQLENDVVNNPSKWIECNTHAVSSQEVHYFPTSVDASDNVYQQLVCAVNEMYSYIKENPYVQVSNYELQYLKWRFIDNWSSEEIISELCKTSKTKDSAAQKERNYRRTVISKLLGRDGVHLADNVRLSPALVENFKTMADNLERRPIRDLSDCYQTAIDGNKLSVFMDVLGLEAYSYKASNINDGFFIKVGDHKHFYDIFVKEVIDFLREHPWPLSVQTVSESLQKNSKNDMSNDALSETILFTHPDIEQLDIEGDSLFQLKYSCLTTSAQRIARIIFEEKKELSYREIEEIDKAKDPSGDGIHAYNSGAEEKFDNIVVRTRAGFFGYNSGNTQTFSRLVVKDFIESYGEKHDSFSFDEIKNALRNEGLSGNDKTLRTYILQSCATSRSDSNIFKLRSTIDDKNLDQWNKCHSYGTKNKVLRYGVEALENAGEIDFDVLRNQILNRMTDAEVNLRYRIRTIIGDYSCKDENDTDSDKALFFFDESANKIKLNTQVVEQGIYDLDKIGFIDKKPAYYQSLLAKAVEVLKASVDKKCLLSNLLEKCRDLIPKSATPFYKLFRSDNLSNYSEELERKGDWIYLKTEKLQSASFEVKVPATVSTSVIDPPLVAVERQAAPTFEVNWDVLLSSMQKELSFYGKTMWNLKISWDDALTRLVKFLKDSQNNIISDRIPRDMIALWNYKIDKYDLYDFLTHLSTSFEALIREIYRMRNGSTPAKTEGLSDTMGLMDDTAKWSKAFYDKNCTGFDHILRDLRFKRNAICHGADVELSTFQMSQAVNNYIALYVYTVARFCPEQ